MKYSITISSDNPHDLVSLLTGTAIGTLPGVVIGGSPVPGINADDTDDDTGPVVAIAPGELDVTGLPWDERIHAGTKTKTAAGNWKKRKNVDDNTITAVEGELRARLSAQTAPGVVPPPTVPQPPAAPVVTPPPAPVVAAPPHDPIAAAVADGWIAHPTSPGYYYKGQDVQTTDAVAAMFPAPAAAPAAPVAAPTGPKTFHDLMQAISNGVAAGKIDVDGVYVGQLAASLGIGAITEVAANPDKITQAFAKLAADGKL